MVIGTIRDWVLRFVMFLLVATILLGSLGNIIVCGCKKKNWNWLLDFYAKRNPNQQSFDGRFHRLFKDFGLQHHWGMVGVFINPQVLKERFCGLTVNEGRANKNTKFNDPWVMLCGIRFIYIHINLILFHFLFGW